VLDRLIQQAVMQVLQRSWDHTFSESSYPWVLPPYKYTSAETLLANLNDVIAPAEAKAKELVERRKQFDGLMT
jgi:hypothetical protein